MKFVERDAVVPPMSSLFSLLVKPTRSSHPLAVGVFYSFDLLGGSQEHGRASIVSSGPRLAFLPPHAWPSRKVKGKCLPGPPGYGGPRESVGEGERAGLDTSHQPLLVKVILR